MSQTHSLLVRELASLPTTQIQEADLPNSVVRHLRALRIEARENIDFLDGSGKIVFARCIQTKPYTFEVFDQSMEAEVSPAFHLFLSPPRKDTLGQTLSQATEMGVRRITFLKTDHNDLSLKDHERSLERGQRILEASVEQCRAPYLPILSESFGDFTDLPSKVPIFFADEDLSRSKLFGLEDPNATLHKLRMLECSQWILLIGPEGGWSARERKLIEKYPLCFALGLGSQILKVPTACVAALSLLQSYRLSLQKD